MNHNYSGFPTAEQIKIFQAGDTFGARDINEIIKRVNELTPAVAVIHCKHCGQWGARYCECIKCGAPIE